MTMNRREFGKSLAAAVAALSLPKIAVAKTPIDRSLFGYHFAELDNNDAIFQTVQRAFGSLWYGNAKPNFIMSPYRVTGRVWNALARQQKFHVKCNRSRYNVGFLFCGATWFGNDALTDEVVLMNELLRDDVRFNGWYRASKVILEDPFGDECFERMIRS